LIAIREDALAKLDRFKGRIPNLFDNYLRMEHLDPEAAREAIVKPLEQYNRLYANGSPVSIEPALVAAVLEQTRTGQVIVGEAGRGAVQGEGGAEIETPYLQLVMTRLWDETVTTESVGAGAPHPYTLRLETLERLGGAEKIVRTHLDTTMSALPPPEQEVAANIFNFLVTPSGTKIAHTAHDLANYAHLPQSEITPTLEKLSSGDVRILRPVAPPLDRPNEPRYEIFHDVLGAPILDWRSRYVQAQEKIEGEKKLAAEQSRVRRLRFGLIGLSLLLLAVIALAVFALTQRQEAERASAEALAQRDAAERERNNAEAAQAKAVAQQKLALSREVASSAEKQLVSDPERALLLAAEAVKISPSGQAESALRNTLVNPWRVTLRGHSDFVHYGEFSPDGKLIATAGQDGNIGVWDTVTHQLISKLPWLPLDSELFPRALFAFSPNSELIAVASANGIPLLYEARTGNLLHRFVGHEGNVFGVNFSPDGNRLVSWGVDQTARVWDVETGQQVFELDDHNMRLFHADFSPDGKWIASSAAFGGSFGGDTVIPKSVILWDAATGELVHDLSPAPAKRVLFSPDSKFLAGISELGPDIWDVETGARVGELLTSAPVTSISYSPDGTLILLGDQDGSIMLVDAHTGALLTTAKGHETAIYSAVFDATGDWILTASQDQTARLWLRRSVPAGITQRQLLESVQVLQGHSAIVGSALFSPDGQTLLTASIDGTARLWDFYRGAFLRGHTNAVTQTAWSPDGRWLATTSEDGSAIIWDPATRKMVSPLKGHTNTVTHAVFHPDGKTIATGGADGTVRVWNPESGELLFTLQTESDGVVNELAYSPDGKWLAFAQNCARGSSPPICIVTPGVYNAQTGELVHQGPPHERGAADIAFSADGKSILSFAMRNRTFLWDAASGEVIRTFEGKTPQFIPTDGTAQLSRDGSIVITYANRDGILHIWDAASETQLAEIQWKGGYTGGTGAALSPDGNHIFSSSDDNAVRVWDARSGYPVIQLKGHTAPITSIRFSKDGKFVVTSSQDRTARMWNADTGELVRILYQHTDDVTDASVSPDGKWIATASADGTAQIFPCDVCGSLDELLALAQARVTRDLTCQERVTFLHETVECETP
jgi:WD40 repeat protein